MFGMGTGVTPSLSPPENLWSIVGCCVAACLEAIHPAAICRGGTSGMVGEAATAADKHDNIVLRTFNDAPYTSKYRD